MLIGRPPNLARNIVENGKEGALQIPNRTRWSEPTMSLSGDGSKDEHTGEPPPRGNPSPEPATMFPSGGKEMTVGTIRSTLPSPSSLSFSFSSSSLSLLLSPFVSLSNQLELPRLTPTFPTFMLSIFFLISPRRQLRLIMPMFYAWIMACSRTTWDSEC